MRSRCRACLLVLLAVAFCVSLAEAATPPVPEINLGQQARPGQQSIPAGTEVIVRTDSEISIGTAKPGDIFPATLDEDILEKGKVLVRQGAPAEVRLMKMADDRDELAFQLYTITVDGKKLRVVSDTAREVARKEAPKQEPGLGGVGKNLLGQAGTAALGGALGAKPGTLTWSSTAGQEAKVPAGTFLEFTLREQVMLK